MSSFISKFKKLIPPKSKKTGLTITVSGLSGSGKTTVSKFLAEKLNLNYFSPGTIIRDEAKKSNKSLLNFTLSKHDELQLMVDTKVLLLASKGGCILDGRVTSWVAGSYADIRIFITAPDDERYLRISGRENISIDKSKLLTIKRDRNDAKTYKNLYNINLFDLSIYTLIVDTTGLKPSECNKIVFDALKNYIDFKKLKI
ncbi:MAG: cytidylate kinase family protein [DPANN group archaeon]|nr:cytidylate kinase family protein [DPANN group archaeon]